MTNSDTLTLPERNQNHSGLRNQNQQNLSLLSGPTVTFHSATFLRAPLLPHVVVTPLLLLFFLFFVFFDSPLECDPG